MKPKPDTAFLREMRARLKLATGEAVAPDDVVDGLLGPAVPPSTCECGKSGDWQQGNASMSFDEGDPQPQRVAWRHVPCGKVTYR